MKKTMITGALALALALTAGTGLAAQTVGPVANTVWAKRIVNSSMDMPEYEGVFAFEIRRFTAAIWEEYQLWYGTNAKARQAFQGSYGFGLGIKHNVPFDNLGIDTSGQKYTQSGDTVTGVDRRGRSITFDFTGWTKVPGMDASKWPASMVYDTSVAPAELRGTWVRKGADSGRDFDTTLTVTANQMEIKYSDGRSTIRKINSIRAITNDPNDANNKAANKAADYPTGWQITVTTTAVGGGYDSDTVGENFRTSYFLNAAKNRLTHRTDDLTDIFVKQ